MAVLDTQLSLHINHSNYYNWAVAYAATDVLNMKFAVYPDDHTTSTSMTVDYINNTDRWLIVDASSIKLSLRPGDTSSLTEGEYWYTVSVHISNPYTYDSTIPASTPNRWVLLAKGKVVATYATTSGVTTLDALDELSAGEKLFNVDGGLYPDWANTIPADHAATMASAVASIQPRDTSGNIDAVNGKKVFIMTGMSHAAQIGDALADLIDADGTFDPKTYFVNCARSGESIEEWTDPDEVGGNYDLADIRITAEGHDRDQVQAAFLFHGKSISDSALPNPITQRDTLLGLFGDVIRAHRERYPQLKAIFLVPIPPTMYADDHPEPYCRLQHVVLKSVLAAQIHQVLTNEVDAVAGDLSPTTTAAIDWAVYWGTNSDWPRSYFEDDGFHPSRAGEAYAAGLMLTFLKTGTYTEPWVMP